jgi:hypothetical protein
MAATRGHTDAEGMTMSRRKRPGVTIGLLLALTGGCVAVPGCFLRTADGLFLFWGAVVDGDGEAVPNALVKARNHSAVSDQDGCFQIAEMTYPGRSEMPFAVTATGFRPYVGSVTNVDSSRRLMRIVLTDASSTSEAMIDRAVKKGTLGVCETKPTPAAWQ